MSSLEVSVSRFVFEHKSVVSGVLCAIPIAIESFRVMKLVWDDPQLPKKFFRQIKSITVDSLVRHEGEDNRLHYRRVALNVLKIAFFAGLFSAAFFIPLVIFPPSLAIPAAIASIFSVGLVVDKREILFNRVKKAKNWLQSAFVKQVDEPDDVARKRILKNVLITASIVAVAAAIIGSAFFLHYASHTMRIWDIVDHIPFQTPAVVTMEYFALACTHFYQGVKKLDEGSKGSAFYHFASGVMGVYFPFFYAMKTRPELRLHHSFIGLALQLLPFSSFRFMGSFITIDSFLYAFAEHRSHSYDIINLIIEHFPTLLACYTFAMMMQITLDVASIHQETEAERAQKRRDREVEEKKKAHLIELSEIEPQYDTHASGKIEGDKIPEKEYVHGL